MPAVMRRSAVGSQPSRRSSRVQHEVVERDQQHHQQRVQRLHLRRTGTTHGLVISSACSTQVEAFWSNSDQNGVTSAKSTSTRSTARTPSTASSGCRPRARSSCSHAPPPMPPISSHQRETGARSRSRASRSWLKRGQRHQHAGNRDPQTGPRLPGSLGQQRGAHHAAGTSAGSGGGRRHASRIAGGPAQKMTVAMNISAPGNAEGDRRRRSACRNSGISSDAKNEPKLMIQ